MIRLAVVFILVFSRTCIGYGQSVDSIPIHNGSLKQATERAISEDRDFLVIVYKDTLNPLYTSVWNLLQDSIVRKPLSERILVLSEPHSSNQGKSLLKQFGSEELPLIIFVNVEGEELVDFEGRVESDQFLDMYSRYVRPLQ